MCLTMLATDEYNIHLFTLELTTLAQYYANPMRKKPYTNRFSSKKILQNPESKLGQILARADKIAIHQETIRNTLEPNSRKHCWLAGCHDGILYLQSDSAVWATRIRMQQHTIIKQLKSTNEFHDVRAMRISVRPKYQKPSPKITAKPMSDYALKHIRESTADIEDSKLRAAMEKLADRK